ncbi:hypothetical protein CN070_18120 [Sinorhizobium meliloti]|nr:hypothetical protein [Sinorhizobium meliloti]RVP99219.1 hypothetical protein CN070_18120 [Sinorhizobium meliloti]
MQVVTSMLHQLNDWMLVSDTGLLVPNAYARYNWNKPSITQLIALKILDNILLGPAYVAQKYGQSVPAVFVRKRGDEYTGTGFLATNRTDATKHVIVTANTMLTLVKASRSRLSGRRRVHVTGPSHRNGFCIPSWIWQSCLLSAARRRLLYIPWE